MWQIPCFTRYFWFFSFVIFPTGPSSIYIFIVSSYFAKCQKGYVGIVISKPSLDYLEVQYVHFHSRDTLSSLHFWRLPLTLSSILYIYIYIYIYIYFRFTPCKADQLLQGMELQEKAEDKNAKHARNLFRKNPKIKAVN